MVWKERGKYGIHTGRTLRKPSKSMSLKDSGFLIKTITNTEINFSDQDARRCLKNFQADDGFDDEDVVSESRHHRHWGFGGGGWSDNSLLYSIGKRKRWLMPTVLRERISENFDSDSDFKVVLVERVSVNDSSLFYQSPRLKHGDCSAVLDGLDFRRPKRRKFAHVGDLRKESGETEIFYEVNHTEPSTSWPSYLQHDWREARDQNKSRCKEKGRKNKRRLWGGYKKFELGKQACENHQNTLFEQKEITAIGKAKVQVINAGILKHSLVDDDAGNGSMFRKFEIGNYICESLTNSSLMNCARKCTNNATQNDGKRRNGNPASSQFVNLHGKGTAVYIDLVTPQNCHDNNGNRDFATPGVSAQVANENTVPSKVVSMNADVQSEKLDPCVLFGEFRDTYQESDSLPRRFSIWPRSLESKLVFTCQFNSGKHSSDGTERVAVTVVGNALPDRKWQDVKIFLSTFLGIFEQERLAEEQASDTTPHCSPNSGSRHPSRVAVMSFDLLCDVNRWSYKSCPPSLAVPNGLTTKRECSLDRRDSDECEGNIIPADVTCEICCCEFTCNLESSDGIGPTVIPCTAMRACRHWFCNDCWKSYLSAEVQHGNTFIKCPGYDCDAPVDDVTMMALLPDTFPKVLRMRQDKAVEVNTAWKWCPGDKCNLVVMGTKQTVAKETGRIPPVPIHCDCGHDWCFACQEEPHWPASCAEAAIFRAQTETYEKIVRAKSGGITSVNVKRCPHCNYPIEKNKGCPHMTCAMCMGEFCWECLENWANHEWGAECSKRSKHEEEVELVNHIGSTRFNSNLRVAIANRLERTSAVLYKKYRVVKELDEVLQLHDAFFEGRTRKNELASAPCMLLSRYNSNKVPKYCKASADFKFQAHFVIEGLSILMAVSKTKFYHNKLKRLISLLLFVTERLENMANSRQFCADSDKVHFQRLLNAGMNCLDSIRKLCVKVHEH